MKTESVVSENADIFGCLEHVGTAAAWKSLLKDDPKIILTFSHRSYLSNLTQQIHGVFHGSPL